MKIQAGYEISYDCAQPTPMILMLSVHPSRIADLITPDRLRLDPAIPANSYHDGFRQYLPRYPRADGQTYSLDGFCDPGQWAAGRGGAGRRAAFA